MQRISGTKRQKAVPHLRLASHRGGSGSIPGQVMWDLWWTKWHWGLVFSEYFDFPCQFSFHRLLHIHHHLSSGAGTIGQLVAELPSGLSLTPPQEKEKKSYRDRKLQKDEEF
jgi:hypothetical protein